MGVRGLTTFIAQNPDRYLKRYELHDTYLVIDGNNLAAQLYKWHAKCYDCFGGDYDKYAQCVLNFFNSLRECNVTPLIIFDGGYENKKLKTVYSRIKTRIQQAKILNSVTENSMTVFPLFLRELFVEIILKLNLKCIRCLVEADFEMACISRKLSCPILSYDSDFYIFDVEYIPFNTLTLHTVKNSKQKDYKYLDCQIYRVDHFLAVYKGLKKECMPLLGVLLGNDYIRISVFRNFYRHLKKARNKPGHSDQQRRIKSLIAWLQTETFESAIRKVLGRTRQAFRKRVAKQIQSVADNYVCSESDLFKYFNLKIDENIKKKVEIINTEIDLNDIEDELSDSDDSNDENEEIGSSESEEDELIEDQKEESKVPSLPSYFEEKYIRCLYPACFLDIVIHNRYFFIPLIEDYYKSQCQKISLKILAEIATILSENNVKDLKYILRNEFGRMGNYCLRKLRGTELKLTQLEFLTQDDAIRYILTVLEMDDLELYKELDQFPAKWRLYIVSIIYWIEHADPSVNEYHIDALLFSAIILDIIGWEFCRSEAKFLKKYKNNLNNIQNNAAKTLIPTESTTFALDSITNDEKIMIMKEIISYFDMIIKLRRNPKLFDRCIIHMYAQFQSCAYHIKFLNTLLNNPFENYLIGDFFNGTLIYNLTNNFSSRPQLDTYLQILMRNAPNVYSNFVLIKEFIKARISGIASKHIVPKRKRRRKKKANETDIDVDVDSDGEDDDIYDENNRFSALKILDE
ncbi:asteroid protein [Holotrichia oblita]|uniref:Asteroid protein n=1 Tax=Holotrichia oblita TaxID=644536 RepID=A0ACB9TCK5_HOLOL|nr:asteroid protein [Holotrichia oblita]